MVSGKMNLFFCQCCIILFTETSADHGQAKAGCRIFICHTLASVKHEFDEGDSLAW